MKLLITTAALAAIALTACGGPAAPSAAPASPAAAVTSTAPLVGSLPGKKPSAKPLTAFQQCVQAYEQHPNETAQQIVPDTAGCRTIPLGQAEVTALFDAAHHDNPATAKP